MTNCSNELLQAVVWSILKSVSIYASSTDTQNMPSYLISSFSSFRDWPMSRNDKWFCRPSSFLSLIYTAPVHLMRDCVLAAAWLNFSWRLFTLFLLLTCGMLDLFVCSGYNYRSTDVGFCGLWGLSIGVMVFILYKLCVLLPYTYPIPKLSPHRRLCASLDFQKNTI